MWEWSDLRHFLAVARHGTTLAAARAAGVNQTTCARRIAALEQALDVKLFERRASGYELTAIGAALVADAERAEAGALEFARQAAERTRTERGVIRFSTSDVLADLIAQPAVLSFARVRPNVRVLLNVDSRHVDLASGEADVVLRAEPSFSDPQLIARKVMNNPWAFYCHADYIRRRAPPADMTAALDHPLAMLAGRPTEIVLAMRADADIRHSTNSMPALVKAITGGDCIGALPTMIGDRSEALQRCFMVDIETIGLWIIYHERLRGAPQIRAFVDHLAGEVGRMAAALNR